MPVAVDDSEARKVSRQIDEALNVRYSVSRADIRADHCIQGREGGYQEEADDEEGCQG